MHRGLCVLACVAVFVATSCPRPEARARDRPGTVAALLRGGAHARLAPWSHPLRWLPLHKSGQRRLACAPLLLQESVIGYPAHLLRRLRRPEYSMDRSAAD